MAWHIVVQSEDGIRENVGGWTNDLEEIATAALNLADELGHLVTDKSIRTIVHIVSDTDIVELSLTVLPGGLDPIERHR